VPIEQRAARRDLTALPLLLFLLGWLVDGFWIGNRRTPKVDTFDLGRLAAPLILLLLGCTDPLHRAHRANERGIAADEAGRHLAARPHYLRSIGFRQRAEVPTHNLARSAVLRGDYAGAHDLFQQALELAPTLPEAHFNDGVALYLWGQSLRDPEGCQLERTRDLWSQARSRFETAREHAPEGSPLANDAAADHRFVDQQLAEVEALIADPPAHCSPPEASEAGGGGGGEGGGGGGGDEDEDAGGDGGGSPPSDPPPGQGQDGTGSGNAENEENQDNQDNQEGAGAPLTTGELEEIQGQLERIREQAHAEGKFHRRTAAEQFDPESWQNPEPIIWW
jgi:tetratricopeptide (TPR) repeat protein